MNDNKQKPKKIRVVMECYGDDRLLFTPQGTRQPQYESLKKIGGWGDDAHHRRKHRLSGGSTESTLLHRWPTAVQPPTCATSSKSA